MSCCCLKTLNLCKVPVCGVLEINQLSGDSGEDFIYRLVLDFLQTQLTITEQQTGGENIHFDVSMLNESFEYTGQILNDQDEPVEITFDSEVYDCIKFKTVMNVAV